MYLLGEISQCSCRDWKTSPWVVWGQPTPALKIPVEGTVSGRTKYVIQCHHLFLVNINLSSCSSLFQLGSFISLQWKIALTSSVLLFFYASLIIGAFFPLYPIFRLVISPPLSLSFSTYCGVKKGRVVDEFLRAEISRFDSYNAEYFHLQLKGIMNEYVLNTNSVTNLFPFTYATVV